MTTAVTGDARPATAGLPAATGSVCALPGLLR
jgi:hypothetical protein